MEIFTEKLPEKFTDTSTEMSPEKSTEKFVCKSIDQVTITAKKLSAISLVILILFANILFIQNLTGAKINSVFILVSQTLVLLSLVFMLVYFLGIGLQKFLLTPRIFKP